MHTHTHTLVNELSIITTTKYMNLWNRTSCTWRTQKAGSSKNLGVLAGEEVFGAVREHRPQVLRIAGAASALHGFAPPQLIHPGRFLAGRGVVDHVEEQVMKPVPRVPWRCCVGLPDRLQLLYGRQVRLRRQPCTGCDLVNSHITAACYHVRMYSVP